MDKQVSVDRATMLDTELVVSMSCSDALKTPSLPEISSSCAFLAVNQSTRAWMWSKSSASAVNRAYSEQMDSPHLWHSRHAAHAKRTSAPTVRPSQYHISRAIFFFDFFLT